MGPGEVQNPLVSGKMLQGHDTTSRLAPPMQEEQVGLWKYIQTFGLVTSPSCNLLLTQLRFPKDHLCRYVLTQSGIVIPHQMQWGWSEVPVPEVSSSSWWHSVWLPSNTGDGISGNETVPTGVFQLSGSADYSAHLPLKAILCRESIRGTQHARQRYQLHQRCKSMNDPISASYLFHKSSSAQAGKWPCCIHSLIHIDLLPFITRTGGHWMLKRVLCWMSSPDPITNSWCSFG